MELRLWALASFVNLLTQPKNSQLLVLRQSRSMFIARAWGAIAALASAAVLIPPYAISGALSSLALGRLINLVTVHYLARQATQAARRQERRASEPAS